MVEDTISEAEPWDLPGRHSCIRDQPGRSWRVAQRGRPRNCLGGAATMKNRLRSASPIFSTFPFRLPEIRLDCPKRRGSASLKEAFMGQRDVPADDERIQ